MTKLVIVLSGGSLFVSVRTADADNAIVTVMEQVKNGDSTWIYLGSDKTTSAVFDRTKFLGCYLDMSHDPLRERAVEAIEKMATASTEGDEWKGD